MFLAAIGLADSIGCQAEDAQTFCLYSRNHLDEGFCKLLLWGVLRSSFMCKSRTCRFSADAAGTVLDSAGGPLAEAPLQDVSWVPAAISTTERGVVLRR